MITDEQLMSFHTDGGILAGYPWNNQLGLDFSGGSLEWDFRLESEWL